MKIAVVGGGFTGCMAALHASARGAQVSLFETAEQLGGVLREVELAGRRYFNNCQYLRPGALDGASLDADLELFDHEYGSLTALGNGQPRLLDDCAQPALDGPAQLDEHCTIDGSALDRLRAYGEHSQALVAWASGFGELSRLDHRCTVAMQVSRIYFPQDPALAAKKSASQVADELIAIPRRKRSPARTAEPAMLPRHGFSALFGQIEQRLLERGVDIHTASPARLTSTGEPHTLQLDGREMAFDWIVWSANPTAVLKRLCGLSLRTPPVPMELLVGRFPGLSAGDMPVPLPYYWQVFDQASPIVRVYLYQLEGEVRFSVEAFAREDAGALQSAMVGTFGQLGLPPGAELAGQLRQLRHVNYSPEELQGMQEASRTLLDAGIIPGGWCHYGRAEKVDSIKKLLDRVMA